MPFVVIRGKWRRVKEKRKMKGKLKLKHYRTVKRDAKILG
jgi:hypothetical protein